MPFGDAGAVVLDLGHDDGLADAEDIGVPGAHVTVQSLVSYSQRLAALGRLTSGVAHEVKNPLAIIRAGTDYLLRVTPPENAEAAEVIEDIQNAVARANNVIGGLLDFAAATDLTTTVEDLNDVIEASLRLVQHALTREHVVLVRELAPDLPTLMLDRTKIEQVFVNLFINAIDEIGRAHV